MDKISSLYGNKENIIKIRDIFHSNRDLPSVTLPHFFKNKVYTHIKKEILILHYKKMMTPIFYSYLAAKPPTNLQTILNSKEFLNFLSSINGRRIKKIKGSIECFGWKNYMILNDEVKEKPGIDVIIDFTDSWDKKFGGSLVYVDGTGSYTKIPASSNTLIIAERKKNVQKFVQYVNHLCTNRKRFFFLGTLQ